MKLQNKLHGPIHYKIGVTGVFNGREINALAITRQFNPSIFKCNEFTSVWSMLSIFKFSRPCYEFTSVWSMFSCITYIHLSCLVRAAVMRYTFLEDFLISNSNSVESCSDTPNPFHFECNENTLV